jgi:hypothetical protein
MKKIPNVFVRDFSVPGAPLTDEVNPESQWVMAGEGVATAKWDGTACMIRDGVLFKRYDRKPNRNGDVKAAPDGWEPCQDPDPITLHWPGWVPVGDEPESKWIRGAAATGLRDGTYECCGPHFQGNPHNLEGDMLIPHGSIRFEVERTRDGIIRHLESCSRFEGIVFHHQDGSMAKVRRVDFGLAWPPEGDYEKAS